MVKMYHDLVDFSSMTEEKSEKIVVLEPNNRNGRLMQKNSTLCDKCATIYWQKSKNVVQYILINYKGEVTIF